MMNEKERVKNESFGILKDVQTKFEVASLFKLHLQHSSTLLIKCTNTKTLLSIKAKKNFRIDFFSLLHFSLEKLEFSTTTCSLK